MTSRNGRLRVAFVDQTGDEAGGAQESFALLLTHLPSSIDPRVLVFHDGKYAQRLRDLGLNVSVLSVSAALAASKRERPRLGGMVTMPSAVIRLAAWLRANRIEVVYTHTVKAHFVGAPASRLAGTRCVTHLRDILEGRPLAALRTICSFCAQQHIAISDSVARAYALPLTTVVFNPLDLAAYRAVPSRAQACDAMQIPDEPHVPHIGIVGRINRWKGHDRFLRIARAVRDRMPARFFVFGSAVFRDAEFVDELHCSVRELGLEDCVRFIPWTDDVRNAYAVLDVHVNCSDREPFGRSVIEAAACGVPSVCFADAGVSEVLQDGVSGRVVPCADEPAFAQAIIDLLAQDRRQAYRDAAKAWAQQFAAEAHAQSVADILLRAAA